MARYIDADALIDFLDVGHLRHPSELCFSEVDVANMLLHAPTVSPDEVRGVVRCKDCTFGKHETDGNGNPCVLCENSMVFDYPYAHDPDWFCADGEMKGAEDGTTDN